MDNDLKDEGVTHIAQKVSTFLLRCRCSISVETKYARLDVQPSARRTAFSG